MFTIDTVSERIDMTHTVRIDLDSVYRDEMVPHMNLLLHYAQRLTNNEEDAKDLLQETYLKAFRFIDRYEPNTNAKAWLFRILKNTFINSVRKSGKMPKGVDFSDAELLEVPAEACDVAARTDQCDKVIGDDIASVMESLSDEHRTIIILSDIEQLTYKEIAQILALPSGTVRSRLHRARSIMQNALYTYAVSHGCITKKSAEAYRTKNNMNGQYAKILEMQSA
jgi:RNA polymerase sigma-70 factor (ECF subfamily)